MIFSCWFICKILHEIKYNIIEIKYIVSYWFTGSYNNLE
nr:MAG TPA: hypothetical protein [Caudoviricetes sp.]